MTQVIFEVLFCESVKTLYICSPIRKMGQLGEMGEWLKPPVC